MSINIITPQYRDSSISTMLRTNSNELFEFTINESVINKIDSLEKLPVTDSNNINQTSNTEIIQTITTTATQDSQIVTDNIPIDTGMFINWGTFPVYKKLKSHPDSIKSDTLLSTTQESGSNESIIINKMSNATDWMTVVIVLILFTIGWLKMNFSKQLSQIFKEFFSLRQSNRLFYEQNSLQQRISGILEILFFFITSVFISQILRFYDYQFLGLNHTYSSLILSFIYLALIYSKIFIYQTLGYLFDNIQITSEFIHNTFVFKKVLAISLLPFIISIPFIPKPIAYWLIWGGIFLYSLFYFLQILRGLQIILIKRQSIIYSVLYLCGLEIIPILIILKIVRLFL